MFKKIFWKSKLEKVFTPGTVARLTYVERSAPENDFKKHLNTPGIQIILYGYSGSGKTTLCGNILSNGKNNHIVSRCKSDTTIDKLILDAFDQLNKYYKIEETHSKKYKISSELASSFSVIRSKIQSQDESSKSCTNGRVIPVQLTPQRLAEFMGASECIWVIEDFHKVRNEDKKQLADILKIFVDNANTFNKTKIICIGAVATAREMVELDPNLSNRVAEISVPLMEDKDLNQIVNKGSCLMNISMSKDISDKIIYFSNNLGLLCHQLCYDICYNKNIVTTKFKTANITAEDLKDAVSSHIRQRSDTYNRMFDKINSIDIGLNILTNVLNIGKEFFSISDFRKELKDSRVKDHAKSENVLESFTNSSYEEIIRYDVNSKKYSFSNPFVQSFFKMKIALLELENKNYPKKNDKRYSLLKYYSESDMIIDERFLDEYYAFFEQSLQRKLKYYKKQIDKDNG